MAILTSASLRVLDLTQQSLPETDILAGLALQRSPLTTTEHYARPGPACINALRFAGAQEQTRGDGPPTPTSPRGLVSPLTGGCAPEATKPNQGDLIVTGHGDGSVRFWQAYQGGAVLSALKWHGLTLGWQSNLSYSQRFACHMCLTTSQGCRMEVQLFLHSTAVLNTCTCRRQGGHASQL